MKVILCIFTVLLGICLATPIDQCSQYTDCETCIADVKCGFSGNLCLSGDDSGPSSSSSTLEDQWNFFDCPNSEESSDDDDENDEETSEESLFDEETSEEKSLVDEETSEEESFNEEEEEDEEEDSLDLRRGPLKIGGVPVGRTGRRIRAPVRRRRTFQGRRLTLRTGRFRTFSTGITGLPQTGFVSGAVSGAVTGPIITGPALTVRRFTGLRRRTAFRRTLRRPVRTFRRTIRGRTGAVSGPIITGPALTVRIISGRRRRRGRFTGVLTGLRRRTAVRRTIRGRTIRRVSCSKVSVSRTGISRIPILRGRTAR